MPVPVLQFGVPGGPELLILLITVAFGLVPLIPAALIYRGAKRRDSRHALAWGLAAFVGALPVWLLYLVVRDEIGQ